VTIDIKSLERYGAFRALNGMNLQSLISVHYGLSYRDFVWQEI